MGGEKGCESDESGPEVIFRDLKGGNNPAAALRGARGDSALEALFGRLRDKSDPDAISDARTTEVP